MTKIPQLTEACINGVLAYVERTDYYLTTVVFLSNTDYTSSVIAGVLTSA